MEKSKLIVEEFKENIDLSRISKRYLRIYDDFDEDLKTIFAYYHERIDFLFDQMNSRSMHNHYFIADDSRELLNIIDILNNYQSLLNDTKYSFSIVDTYQKHLEYTLSFLRQYRGSIIPDDYTCIVLLKYAPIFIVNDGIIIENNNCSDKLQKLKNIGNGAYATVYSFEEPLTNIKFAMKRLNKEVVGKEIERFKREFQYMNTLNNPYILKSYSFNESDNSYLMELCDQTLKDFISINNNRDYMNFRYRKNIVLQILKGFNYLHSKGILHRDISYKNILIKKYDDNVVIIKIADFGLAKDLNLENTRTDSEIRGTIIDDTLTTFKNYSIKNEIYAIGVIIWFVFTGKTSLKLDNSEVAKIVQKCINRDHNLRYSNVNEIIMSLSVLSE